MKFGVVLLLSVSALIALFVSASLAEPPSPLDPVPFEGGKVPDHLKTLVIGTRFVRSEDSQASPERQFRELRVPLADFNAADRCVDEASIGVAQDYFRTLGRMLETAGYFFHIPPEDVARLTDECTSRHGTTPSALSVSGTKIIAFGKVVPTKQAPALEQTLR
jgi:hypothetical protein